ncbi:hypothetical protein DY000_02039763 [Brassica cretica]|uniref:Uncharacterized protein n=1 Tax=Brassica cretica TaxID=69181 RepID=A0ABQ7BNY7_BRACR|nr:hypothetical protein DY000_02039763 [Brassica cretica]
MAGSGDSRAQENGGDEPNVMRELRRRYLVVHLVEKLRVDEFLEREIGTLDMCI